MRRRTPPVELLPPKLRTFVPTRWLELGEDRTDPIKVHVRALSRYKKAVCSTTGATVAADVASNIITEWSGPISTREPGLCPCSQCP